MLTGSATLKNALNNGYTLKAVPELIAEWNHNRFGGIQSVDNVPSDITVNPYPGEFPISSIVDPNRPKAGINKARAASKGIFFSNYYYWPKRPNMVSEGGYSTEDYNTTPGKHRFYTVSEESPYKYWCSPSLSNSTLDGVRSGYGFPTGYEVQPTVVYKVSSLTNKIIIGFENSWVNPSEYDIQTTTDGTNWTTVASNVAPDTDGRVILYRQSNGSYTSTVNRLNALAIKGIRLKVYTVNKGGVHLSLIEVSARLELDLTDRLEGWATSLEVSDVNFVTPLGKASSNSGNVSLFNSDGYFNNDNASSPLYNLIDENAMMTMSLIYDLTDFGGTSEKIRQFTMYVESWSGTTVETASATLKDFSKFYQEQKIPPMLLENVTVGEAVWRICDIMGFNDFIYNSNADTIATNIPFFWVDADDTVWDVFTALAESTQTAIYFDEYNVLQIRTREEIFDENRAVNWDFDATNANGKLADIEELEEEYSFESNTVDITYKNTHVSDANNGEPAMEVVWQPDNDFVLRASPVTKSMTTTDTSFYLRQTDVAVWPFTGMVNINGELITYDAKAYSYTDKTTHTTKTVWVASQQEKDNVDKNLSDPLVAYKNAFTGGFRVKERGYGWTSPRAHSVDVGGYATRIAANGSGSSGLTTGLFLNNAQQGTARMSTTNKRFDLNHWVIASRGNGTDAAPQYYGTRIKIDSVATGGNRGGCGMAMCLGTGESGYYVEMIGTPYFSATGALQRKVQQEINFYIRYSNGTMKRVASIDPQPSAVTGVPALITPNIFYNLDVSIIPSGGVHYITVFLNGTSLMRFTLGSSQVPLSGRYGIFHRGGVTADYEYLYAIDNDVLGNGIEVPDNIGSWDYLGGGYPSNQLLEEWTYSSRTAYRRVGKKNVPYKYIFNQYFYDEFAPIAREAREMDVKFSKFPVQHSRIYSTNSTQAVVADYAGTPFGAKFFIANSSRKTAILNGEDTITYGADNSVDQKLFIYGRLIIQDENSTETVSASDPARNAPMYTDVATQTVVVQNADRIRRAGVKAVEIESKWIQNREEAEGLANWILTHWANGTDNITIQTFGNPLVSIGDVVTVNYPDKSILKGTHRYFVTSVEREWDDGLSTKFTLRRKS